MEARSIWRADRFSVSPAFDLPLEFSDLPHPTNVKVAVSTISVVSLMDYSFSVRRQSNVRYLGLKLRDTFHVSKV